MPALAAFANHDSPSGPAQVWKVARPRSISRVAPVAGDLERAVELVRDPERADEVAAGAAVDDRELDALDARDPVHDLVHRPVAADGDEELAPLAAASRASSAR